MAPARGPGPATIGTPHSSRCAVTSASGILVMKHRSPEPGVGLSATRPGILAAGCRLIFCWPKRNAVRPSPKVLPSLIDGEAPNHGHRNRIGHVSSHPPRSLGDRDRAGGEAVIPDDTIAMTDDIAPRGAARLARPRPPAQPVIESGLAACKGGKIVSVAKQLRCREFGKARYSQGALVCISLRSCSFGRGGASSSAMKRA